MLHTLGNRGAWGNNRTGPRRKKPKQTEGAGARELYLPNQGPKPTRCTYRCQNIGYFYSDKYPSICNSHDDWLSLAYMDQAAETTNEQTPARQRKKPPSRVPRKKTPTARATAKGGCKGGSCKRKPPPKKKAAPAKKNKREVKFSFPKNLAKAKKEGRYYDLTGAREAADAAVAAAGIQDFRENTNSHDHNKEVRNYWHWKDLEEANNTVDLTGPDPAPAWMAEEWDDIGPWAV